MVIYWNFLCKFELWTSIALFSWQTGIILLTVDAFEADCNWKHNRQIRNYTSFFRHVYSFNAEVVKWTCPDLFFNSFPPVDTFGAKRCEKRRNCSKQAISPFASNYTHNYRDFPYFWGDIFKDICCRFVICGTGLNHTKHTWSMLGMSRKICTYDIELQKRSSQKCGNG